MIGTEHLIVDDHVLHLPYETLRDQEIVQPPTDIARSGVETIGPPGVIVGVLVEVPVMLALVGFANRTKGWFAPQTTE